MPGNEFLIIQSTDLTVKEVIDRIENTLKEKKVRVFARINHGQAAREVGLTMQDEEVLIFGNPNVGTPLMLENPAIGIELPLKILAWQSEKATKIAFQNLETLAILFQITTAQNTIQNLKTFLENLVSGAISH